MRDCLIALVKLVGVCSKRIVGRNSIMVANRPVGADSEDDVCGQVEGVVILLGIIMFPVRKLVLSDGLKTFFETPLTK